MLTVSAAALACLGLCLRLGDAVRLLSTPDLLHHYTEKTSGGNGYKQIESFHKRDGGSYGLEKRSVLGDGDRGRDDHGTYQQVSSYDSGDHKPKTVSYHYESKHGTSKDDSNYDPETYGKGYSGLVSSQPRSYTPSKPSPGGEFCESLQGEPCQSASSEPTIARRERKYGTFDSLSVEVDDVGFGFYDDDDIDGSFEADFFSGEAASSFETDDLSGEDEDFFY